MKHLAIDWNSRETKAKFPNLMEARDRLVGGILDEADRQKLSLLCCLVTGSVHAEQGDDIVWTTIEYGCGHKVRVAKTDDLLTPRDYLEMPCGKCQLLDQELEFLRAYDDHLGWLAEEAAKIRYERTCLGCDIEVNEQGVDRDGYEHREFDEQLCHGCGMVQLCEGHCFIKDGRVTLNQDYWAAKEKEHFDDVAEVECRPVGD